MGKVILPPTTKRTPKKHTLIRVNKLKEIIELRNIIKADELHYELKLRKVYNFNEYYLPIVF